jgi:hypothetical protein
MTIQADPGGGDLSALPFEFGELKDYGAVQSTLRSGAAFDMLCVGQFHDISTGLTHTVDAQAPDDPALQAYSVDMTAATWLYLAYTPMVDSAASAANDDDAVRDPAELHTAMWDVLHNGGDGLGDVNLQLPAAGAAGMPALASDMISASVGMASSSAALSLGSGIGPQATAIIRGPSGPSTPEPSPFLLLGFGLALLAFVGRKTSRDLCQN